MYNPFSRILNLQQNYQIEICPTPIILDEVCYYVEKYINPYNWQNLHLQQIFDRYQQYNTEKNPAVFNTEFVVNTIYSEEKRKQALKVNKIN